MPADTLLSELDHALEGSWVQLTVKRAAILKLAKMKVLKGLRAVRMAQILGQGSRSFADRIAAEYTEKIQQAAQQAAGRNEDGLVTPERPEAPVAGDGDRLTGTDAIGGNAPSLREGGHRAPPPASSASASRPDLVCETRLLVAPGGDVDLELRVAAGEAGAVTDHEPGDVDDGTDFCEGELVGDEQHYIPRPFRPC